jgi:hypothetical protein
VDDSFDLGRGHGGFRQAHPEPRKESSSLKDDRVMTLRPVSLCRRKPCQSLEMRWDELWGASRLAGEVTQSEEETRWERNLDLGSY